MSTSMYCETDPETEAHLMNDSDWILRKGTVYLGIYAEHDHDTDTWETYALYALPERNGASFGAHFGENPWDYASNELHWDDDSKRVTAGNPAIMVAMIRYLLLIS